MQIGSVLYDLEPGISPNIREEVAGITSLGEEPACPLLGEVQQHAVITPDMDHLLRCSHASCAAMQTSCIEIIGVIVGSLPTYFCLLLASGLTKLSEEHSERCGDSLARGWGTRGALTGLTNNEDLPLHL